MNSTTLLVAALALSVAACGPLVPPNTVPPVASDGLPPASTFSCSGLDGTETLCMDFNDNKAPSCDVEEGDWLVTGGRYVGRGPDATAGCGTSLMSASMIKGLSLQDVRVSVQLASVERVDKVLVLRSIDTRNRFELNFRATSSDGLYGDLMVQELRDCVGTPLTADGEIPLPHAMGEQINAVVEVVGTHVSVHVGNELVLDRDFPILVQPGALGFGVIERSTTVFDDVVIESLDP